MMSELPEVFFPEGRISVREFFQGGFSAVKILHGKFSAGETFHWMMGADSWKRFNRLWGRGGGHRHDF